MLGYMLDTWAFIILMLVKVERQCWLANKCMRRRALQYTEI